VMTRAATPAAVAVVTIIVAVTARIVVGVRQIPRQHGTIRIVGHARVVGTETVGVGIIRTLRHIVVGTPTSGRESFCAEHPVGIIANVNSAITANAERRNVD
jgi:hypothetical protein